MADSTRRAAGRGGRVAGAAAAMLGWLWAAPAPAQVGYGWWFGGYQTPASVTYLNDRAQARTQAALASQPQALRVPARTGRDTTFFERYDPETRRAMEDRVARRPSQPRRPTAPPAQVAAAPAARPSRPAVALSSFFNARGELIWPQDAPTEGELKEKRERSDAAALAVLRETETGSRARIATVTEARDKLVDYGRPALELVREKASGAVEVAFNGFLLSLYDALGASGMIESVGTRR